MKKRRIKRKNIMVMMNKRKMNIKRTKARTMGILFQANSQLSVLMGQMIVLKELHLFQMHVLAM